MIDKPEPPARYQQRYDAPTQYTQMPNGVVDKVTSGVLSAYKVNPILIGMILLLLTILGAVGYYAMRNDDRIYSYIGLRDMRERDLNDRLIEMALKCRDLPTDKTAYPQPKFPNLSTGGESFETPPTPPRRDTR